MLPSEFHHQHRIGGLIKKNFVPLLRLNQCFRSTRHLLFEAFGMTTHPASSACPGRDVTDKGPHVYEAAAALIKQDSRMDFHIETRARLSQRYRLQRASALCFQTDQALVA